MLCRRLGDMFFPLHRHPQLYALALGIQERGGECTNTFDCLHFSFPWRDQFGEREPHTNSEGLLDQPRRWEDNRFLVLEHRPIRDDLLKKEKKLMKMKMI